MTSKSMRRSYIEWGHSKLSIRKQCFLLGFCKSTLYYTPIPEKIENLEMMDLLDKQYLKTPFFGSRRMTVWLKKEQRIEVNRKRVQRLMRLMGMEAIYPKPKTTNRNQEHQIYPYLLRDVPINRVNQVWSTDLTYIRLAKGFVYLSAILDWYSRYVLTWKLSNSMDSRFCIENLEEALERGKPEIFNTDQGSQYTSSNYIKILKKHDIKISMDGKGRALDNVFVERLWRSVKYEEVYLKQYDTVAEANDGLSKYFRFYNKERFHQSLDYKTPENVYLNNEGTNLLKNDQKEAG